MRNAIIAALAALFPFAAATEVLEHIQIRGGNTEANFQASDATGCIVTDVHIEVGLEVYRDHLGDISFHDKAVFVTISVGNACDGTRRDWVGFADGVAFDLAGNVDARC